MSLLMPLDLALPVATHAEASLDLASIHVVYEFPYIFPKSYLGCQWIEMWSSPLS